MTNYQNITMEEMRAVHEALAVKVLESDDFLPLFETADKYLQDMEVLQSQLSPVERARLKLKAQHV